MPVDARSDVSGGPTQAVTDTLDRQPRKHPLSDRLRHSVYEPRL